jgi:(1->4)-alpha-D-glucan 1-alpha-D-glucosylmutase
MEHACREREHSGQTGGSVRFPFVTALDFVPTATYRLQFHRDFTFAHASEILDYLQRLGISDIYSSPFFQAGVASTHGYDVADHNRINPALGGEEGYRAFVAGLRARGMGQVLDFVPNHMGISEPINRWWMDVLENGPLSLYEGYFDIEWHPLKLELENKVLLPILGDRYGRILENGEFRLALEDGAFFLRYHEAKLPLNPRTYPYLLDRVAHRLGNHQGQAFHDELLSISNALASLPDGSPARSAQVALRAREKEVSKRRLARLVAETPAVATAIAGILEEFHGRPGEPATFDALHELLCAQIYRLAYWRVAAEEINYRRFFDVNTLAAIRSEVPEVFAASHELVFKMIERGDITGLRIDHIDGLWDPRAYLENIREMSPGKPVYLIVEKILAHDEWLPPHWPVDGTTGYEFAVDVTGVLMDPSSEQRFTKFYEEFAEDTRLEDLIYQKKLLITRMALSGEVATLGGMLNRLSETNRHYRDFTLNQLTAAVRETIACFPVYRTYISRDAPASDEDRLIILRSIRRARRRNPSIDRPIFDFLTGVLLLDLPSETSPHDWEEHVRFALKFQQCTGPVMAKGLEDTTFYIYHRFVALNEVGGDPGRFGLPPAEFHARCAERQRRTPHTLLATSTHDTKRSEDVRARLTALSELPDEWRKIVAKSAAMNASWKTEVDGRLAPSPNEEYLLYQTLAGAWPLQPLTPASQADFLERIQDYMVKALKEAKLNSSWIEQNDEWEQATRLFVASILDPESGRKFLHLFEPFVQRLAPFGAANSLAQVILKCTTPGVPDFYQGCDLWDFSLVDPDNRRPVDYQRRGTVLESVASATPASLLADWTSGAVKLFLTQRLLALRHRHPQLFRFGTYSPMAVSGGHADRVLAFLREYEGTQLAVVVPRLTVPLGFPALGKVWKNTTLDLPPGRWQDALGNGEHTVSDGASLAELLNSFPAACLLKSP